MKKINFSVLAAVLATTALVEARAPELPVIAEVDITRYMGQWHEIALIPHWFERGCSETTANYTLRPDGRVDVLNQCLREGKTHEARAIAWHDGSGRDGKFKVRFFWPFSAPYWVIALDPGYQWVVVGHPSRHYFWILSRGMQLDAKIYDQLIQQAVALGYDPSQIQRTPQNH